MAIAYLEVKDPHKTVLSIAPLIVLLILLSIVLYIVIWHRKQPCFRTTGGSIGTNFDGTLTTIDNTINNNTNSIANSIINGIKNDFTIHCTVLSIALATV